MESELLYEGLCHMNLHWQAADSANDVTFLNHLPFLCLQSFSQIQCSPQLFLKCEEAMRSNIKLSLPHQLLSKKVYDKEMGKIIISYSESLPL